MNVCQCIKIMPLVLLLSACTIDVDTDTPEADEGVGEDVSSASGSDADSGMGSDDVNSALSASVGSVQTPEQADETDQSGADQSDPVQPVQPNEIAAEVDSPTSATDGATSTAEDPISATDDLTPSTDNPTTTTDDPTSTTDDLTSTTDDPVETSTQVDMPESPASAAIVRIPFTDQPNAPKIDADTLDYIAGSQALEGEWRTAVQFNSENNPLAINQYMFGEPGTNNDGANHHWAAKHDGLYLYLLVVSDDAGEHHQDTNEARKPWKDDSIEIFIDGNHSQLTEYDGVDDFHMTINLFSSVDVANSSYDSAAKIRQSDTSATLPSDLLFVAGPRKGPMAVNVARGRKDIYEIRIKLSELNILVGAPFGIEIQINDDDNGGSRDAKWGWNHPEGSNSDNDFTWQNPSYMGTAILLR